VYCRDEDKIRPVTVKRQCGLNGAGSYNHLGLSAESFCKTEQPFVGRPPQDGVRDCADYGPRAVYVSVLQRIHARNVAVDAFDLAFVQFSVNLGIEVNNEYLFSQAPCTSCLQGLDFIKDRACLPAAYPDATV